MAVSQSFHRNVSLLTQVVPPSSDFKKHFRENMFEKPNTSGFLHVSHYLLTIHNEERFKTLVQWPVMCKKTEAKYRSDVRDYLTVIAAENPDIEFPTILLSHLFHAGGNKFTTIMWKLSEIALRTYITQEIGIYVPPAPPVGATLSITKDYYNVARNKANQEARTEAAILATMEEHGEKILEKKCSLLANIKTEVFEKKKLIASLAESAPVDASIKKRLINTRDTVVIEMWKSSIKEQIKNADMCNKSLKELESLTFKVCNLINNIIECNVLDANELKEINTSTARELVLKNNEGLVDELYNNKQLVFSVFFHTIYIFLQRTYQYLQSRDLMDYTEYLPNIQETFEYVNEVSNHLVSTLESVENLSTKSQQSFNELVSMQSFHDFSYPIMNTEILMPSPDINIDTNNVHDESIDLQNRLALTPVEGLHKSLFSRYLRQNQTYLDVGPRVRPNLLLTRINLADTTLLNTSDKSLRSRKITPKKPVKSIGRYTRLFGSRMKKSNRIANESLMSLPATSKANSTSIPNAIGRIQDISAFSLDITVKSLCDISDEFAPAEKLLTDKEQAEITECRSERDDMLSSPLVKSSKAEVAKPAESEDTSKDTTTRQGKQSRCSIGDLIERYKKLLEASNHSQCEFNHDEEI